MFARFAAIVYVTALAFLLSSVACIASAADISGTLEINKKKFKLTNGYVDVSKPEEPVVVLSDKPLPSDQIPLLAADYAVKKKVHAVVFSVVAKDKKLGDMKFLYLGEAAANPFTVFSDDVISLQVNKIDMSLIEGKIKTLRPVKLSDLSYAFDASYKLSTKAALAKASAPKKVSFTGDDSPPVTAYKEYYRAIMSGDSDALKKFLVAKNLKEFDEMETKDREMVLDVLKLRPEKLKIEKPVLVGEEATFTATGKEGSSTSTGSIKMILEGGVWKVLEDKWSTVSK
jgi:hypothetical protein